MKLNNLPKVKTKKLRRVGRGPGSGRGKTAGRGTKGQNVRGKLPITHSHYEGGQRPLFKRLPYRRGKGNSKVSKKPIIVNLKALSFIPESVSVIDLEVLIKYRIVDRDDARRLGVKILGDGTPKNALTLKLPVSKSAGAKIQKAGGKII